MRSVIGRIAGYEKEKEEILLLRKMLHEFERYRGMGVRIPRGLLISGAPGIGKTELMRALPDRGINTYALVPSDDETYIGENFRKLVVEAKKNAPAVIMIDEFDKLAGGIDLVFSGKKNEITTSFIKSLDLLTADDAVLVVATCNNMKDLTPSLLRAGRFDRILEMNLPNDYNRTKVADKYLKELKFPKKIDANYISKLTPGFSCAEIRSLINEAAIIAADRPEPSLLPADLRIARNRMAFNGSEDYFEKSADEEYKIAIHEAGHALAALKIAPGSLYEASILEQGQSYGHVQLISNDRANLSCADYEKDIMISLAGRVAEREVLGEYMIGSECDLSHALESMIRLTAASAMYGYEYLVTAEEHCSSSEAVKADRDRFIAAKLQSFDNKVACIIRENRKLLDTIVERLMEQKVLTTSEICCLEKEEKDIA